MTPRYHPASGIINSRRSPNHHHGCSPVNVAPIRPGLLSLRLSAGNSRGIFNRLFVSDLHLSQTRWTTVHRFTRLDQSFCVCSLKYSRHRIGVNGFFHQGRVSGFRSGFPAIQTWRCSIGPDQGEYLGVAQTAADMVAAIMAERGFQRVTGPPGDGRAANIANVTADFNSLRA